VAHRVDVIAVESGKGSPYRYDAALADSPPRNYPSIAGRNIFFGAPVVEKTVVETVPREADLAPYIKLISITHETSGLVRAELWDSFNDHEYRIGVQPDGILSVDMFYSLGGRRRRDSDRSGRDIYIGSEETGNYRRYQVVAVSGDDVVIQVPDDVRDVNLRFGGSLVVGGALPTFVPGRCYVWHMGQMLKTALETPMTSKEARQAILTSGGIAPPKVREGR